eukprot:COSAG01_NODE_40542_length_462_cov_1.256198_1_plen_38_part_10
MCFTQVDMPKMVLAGQVATTPRIGNPEAAGWGIGLRRQ